MRRLLGCALGAFALGTASLSADVISADDIITLAPAPVPPGQCPDYSTEFSRVINPDATLSPFVIPNGSVFVITGGSWSSDGSFGYTMGVLIHNPTLGQTRLVAQIPGAKAEFPNNLPDGFAAGIAAISPGVVVGRSAVICGQMVHGMIRQSARPDSRIYGYLAPGKSVRGHARPLNDIGGQ